MTTLEFLNHSGSWFPAGEVVEYLRFLMYPSQLAVSRLAGHVQIEGVQETGRSRSGIGRRVVALEAQDSLQQGRRLGVASTKLKGKKPLNPGMLRRWHLKPAAKSAGISGKIGWHTFRRSLASFLIADGVDVKTVQESLRHSTSKITLDLYAQSTTPNKLAAQRQLIEAIVPKNQALSASTAIN